VGQDVQGQIARTDSEPLRQLDEFSKSDSPTTGDSANSTGQGYEGKGLNLIKLLAKTLECRLGWGVRRLFLSLSALSCQPSAKP
jgi:hypothetical protein